MIAEFKSSPQSYGDQQTFFGFRPEERWVKTTDHAKNCVTMAQLIANIRIR